MSKPRILVVSERYWPEGSGGELATHLIINILSREFKVTVITGSRDPYRTPHVNYIYEPLLSKRKKPLLWFNTMRLVRRERFRKLVEESDIVYIPRFAFPVIPFAKGLGKKVIVHLHDYIPISYTATILAPYEEHRHRIVQDDIFLECIKGLKHCLGVGSLWWLPRLAKEWILQADKVVCVSRRQAEIVADQIPELKDKMVVVYNPLPPELINNEPRKELDNTPTFLYVGGGSYAKGFHILLQALREVGKRGVKSRFILANKYSHRNLKILKGLSKKYGNLEIQIVGRVKYEELVEIHKKAWALIFPSILEETFGYAVIEAVVMGTIPIASNVGAIGEILGDTLAFKFTFSPTDYLDLARKIVGLSSFSTNELRHFGYKLRKQIIEKLNLVNAERNIIKIFQHTL